MKMFLDVARVLMVRVLVSRVSQWSSFKGLVNWHIDHKMSDVLSNMSVVVPLGVLDKCEQEVKQMLSILREDYKKYVPANCKSMLSGGDQMTQSRQFQAKLAIANETTHLQQLVPVFEMWHGKVITIKI